MGPARPQTGRRQRERKSNDKDAAGEVKDAAEDYSPAIKAMRELKELGDERVFDPTITKKDLVGYGPAVATSESTFAKESTVVRQARILGGAEPYHPTNVPWMKDMKQQYNHGNGVFFPTEEMKKWSAERLGLEAFPPAPQETKDAILQDTLLGMYNGPIFSDYGTPLGSVRNYVAKNSSWNADAARRIENKVKSLLPRDIRQPKSTQNRRGHARASF
ncbi:hypothetical protein GGR50DRAFT_677808 [Xylaria sp. CBS 124048]|nr:hypothetical protein GGR50DRAFT_677808 [Xylaria sp. CBS 124048]